jgi:hypothetical protein
MRLRVTLTHATLGTKVINEPDGWPDLVLKLERHPDYHSLFELFEGEFWFYGSNGNIDGGLDFILEAEQLDGPDVTIDILNELSLDDINFIELFAGQLLVSGIRKTQDNKALIPVVRNDFSAKFKNRIDTPVDIQSPKDLDDNDATIFESAQIEFLPQTLEARSETIQKDVINLGNSYPIWDPATYSPTYNEDISTGDIIQINLDDIVLDEITDNFHIPIGEVPTGDERPAALFKMEYRGVYDVDIKISMTWIEFSTDTEASPPFHLDPGIPSLDDQLYFPMSGVSPAAAIDIKMFIQFDEDTPIQLTRTDQSYTFLPPGGSDMNTIGWTEHTYTGSKNFNVGGTIRLWIQNDGDPAFYQYSTTNFTVQQPYILGNENNYFMQEIMDTYYPGDFVPGATIQLYKNFGLPPGVESFINILGHTLAPTSPGDGFLVHDVAGQILDRTIGREGTFYSEYFGSDRTRYRQYDENGCSWEYMLFKGLQIREYSLTEKPFFQSFNNWWNGVNPIFNLGLGYEVVDDVEVMRCEEKEHFYNDTILLNISNVSQITRAYDEEVMIKTFRVGYKKWQSENISGIDDPQTKHTYASRLQKSGRDMEMESTFIAASLAIETTRRTTRKKSADYKFDDDTFIVAVRSIETSPEAFYQPETDEKFSSVTNLLNPETRYNLLLTPARNALRWMKWIAGGLQNYVGSFMKFVSGEGNYDMTSNYGLSDGCDEYDGDLSEKQDLEVPDDYIHRGELYEMTFKLEFEDYLTIRNNRKNAIGISQTDSNHQAFFIKTLEYRLFEGTCTLTAWPKEFYENNFVESSGFAEVCYPVSTDCDNAYETEDEEDFETESGACLILN